ncbi:MAG: hypothetical protein M1136_05165 [Chloroflexi bacterium]|nr:hypothetical protein [Chloroflexota bacterium]MCL5075026.1 hypothetical protein [Chloroflexota bacterium]
MWTVLRIAPNRPIARAWQEFLEEEGIPCELWWSDQTRRDDLAAPCEILVPSDRVHVVRTLILSGLLTGLLPGSTEAISLSAKHSAPEQTSSISLDEGGSG